MSNKYSNQSFSTEVQRFLAGRSLLASELPFSIEKINEYVGRGLIDVTPGVIPSLKAWQCTRCANETPRLFASFPCATCNKDCMYCRNCIMMGRVSTCTMLYHWAGPNPDSASADNGRSLLNWDGQLSEGQEAASKAAINAVNKQEELLIWAVCGAGKTEVLFAGIDEALQRGLRVCIATPRTDVVLELSPRLQEVFPSIAIATLYGGSEDRHKFSPLTITTTHQLLRFKQAFDVMIVDEVDAFPYSFDQSLQWAVKKSLKQYATSIYLTATPNEEWQNECRFGRRPFIKIPARFHRKSLPVPRFQWCGNWRKQLEKNRLPVQVFNWARKRIESKKQALIFLPHIHLLATALPLFQKLHPQIESVHAADPLRKEKIVRMREVEIPLLLTTTILERGVTFPNIDVAVLGAEDDIFTEAALIQIAGRVGRSSKYPSGEVTFFHYGQTKAMSQAFSHIVTMNREAQKAGLLDQ